MAAVLARRQGGQIEMHVEAPGRVLGRDPVRAMAERRRVGNEVLGLQEVPERHAAAMHAGPPARDDPPGVLRRQHRLRAPRQQHARLLERLAHGRDAVRPRPLAEAPGGARSERGIPIFRIDLAARKDQRAGRKVEFRAAQHHEDLEAVRPVAQDEHAGGGLRNGRGRFHAGPYSGGGGRGHGHSVAQGARGLKSVSFRYSFQSGANDYGLRQC